MPVGFPVSKKPVVGSAKCVDNSPDSTPTLRHPWLAPSASGRPKSGGVHPPEAREFQPHGNPEEPDQEQIGAGFLPATTSLSHSKSSGGGCAPLSSLRAYGASVATSTPCGGRAALPHRPRPAAPPPARSSRRKSEAQAKRSPRDRRAGLLWRSQRRPRPLACLVVHRCTGRPMETPWFQRTPCVARGRAQHRNWGIRSHPVSLGQRYGTKLALNNHDFMMA
jgi:hypothetical protein